MFYCCRNLTDVCLLKQGGSRYPPFLYGQGATLKTILINSKRITAKPAQEGIVSMCACTEPVRTGTGAVCVEYGRPKWLINQTHVQKNVLFYFLFLAPYARTTRYEEAFKAKNGLGRFALSALRFSGSSLILSCLTVSFSCGIVYSLVKRTPESEKKKTYAYLIKRKIKRKCWYTYQVGMT